MMGMKRAIWIGLLAALALAGQKDPFVGYFQGDGVALELAGSAGAYKGTLTFQGYRMPARLKVSGGKASGEFDVNGQNLQTYGFALVPEGAGFKLTSDGKEYRLLRQAAPPPAAPKRVNGTIVGNWRSGQRTAKFRADGTGVIDGVDGRYEIKGGQLTLVGPKSKMSVAYGVAGDVLTMTTTGGTVTWNRVKGGGR
jgi:hypothetical protein